MDTPIHFVGQTNSMPITPNLFPVHNSLLGTTPTSANPDILQDLKSIVSKAKVFISRAALTFVVLKHFCLWGPFLHSFQTGCSLYLENFLFSSPGKLLASFRTQPNQHVPQIRVSTSLQTVRPPVCIHPPHPHLCHIVL